MNKSLRDLLFVALAALCFTHTSNALDLTALPYMGVMQQPASHYYHAIYGFNAQIGVVKRLNLRLGAYERPQFISQGYVDQDFGQYVMFGGTVTKHAKYGLNTYIGGGINHGYIREIESKDTKSLRRGYSLRGVVLEMETFYNFKNVGIFAGHRQFIGSDDQAELKALVAWPFSYFTLGFGYQWT